MVSARESLKRVFNCPKLIITGAVFGIIYSLIDNYNPLPGIVMGFSGLGGDLLGTLIAAISAFLSPGTFLKGLFFLMVVILVVSLILGVYMAGFMNLMRSVILNGNKCKNVFSEGIKKNFGRSVKGSVILFISSAVLAIVSAVALLPGMTTMWAAFHGKSEILPIAFFVALLSAFSVFFTLLFFNTYAAFWYPAISMGYIKFIKVSKKVVDNYFFEVAGKVLKYNLEFLLITLICIIVRYFFSGAFQNIIVSAGFIIIEGFLITMWFLRLTNYVTNTFVKLIENF